MGRFHGKDGRVYVDEFDISGLSNAFDLNIDNELQEITAFSGAPLEFLEGKYGHTFSVNSFNELEEDAWDSQLFTIIGEGSLHQIGAYPAGATELTAAGYEMQSRPTRTPRQTEIGGAATLNGEWQGDSPLVRATVLNNSPITGTGVKTGVSLATSASGEVVAVVFRILAVSGSGSIVIAIEESQNDGGGDAYAAIADLASGTLTAVGVTRKTTTGATELWKRINVTTFSGFTSVTLMVSIGPEQ